MRSRPLAFPMHFLRPIFVAGTRQRDEERSLTISLSLSTFSPYCRFLFLSSAYSRSLCNSKDIRSLWERLRAIASSGSFPGWSTLQNFTCDTRISCTIWTNLCVSDELNISDVCWKKIYSGMPSYWHQTSYKPFYNTDIIFILYRIKLQNFFGIFE